MSVTLLSLSDRLEAQFPSTATVSFDYTQIVQDAINQLSNDAPVLRTAQLTVLAGTASYALPTDFLFMVELPSLVPLLAPGQYSPYYPATWTSANPQNGALIPVPQGYSESYDIAGNTITLYPTPTYNINRMYRYAALYELIGTTYPLLNDNAAGVAMLYAQFLIHLQRAGVYAGMGSKYQVDSVMSDRSMLGTNIGKQASTLLDQYNSAVKRLQGSYGSRPQYGLGDVAWLYST
jgi:hypothetical protein